MTDVAAVYRVLDLRMPHHAGSAGAASDVSASLITDPTWMRERLDLACRLYRCGDRPVIGTVWWYSASSVLVAPTAESLVLAGVALDPALKSVTLHVQPDGRFLGARSSRLIDRDAERVGAAYVAALAPAVERVAQVSGARERVLWAIATDSLANRLLWAGQATGDVGRTLELADALSDAMGATLPRMRFARYGTQRVVRRVSCCLIDRATGQQKCTSCPNQHPDERDRRIRAALGLS